MPSVGSSRNTRCGSGDQAAGDGQELLLAARERAAVAVEQMLEAREVLQDVAHRILLVLGMGGDAHAQIVEHAEHGKDAAALGHIADALAAALVRRLAGNVDALEMDAAAGRGHQPDQRFSGGWSCPCRCGRECRRSRRRARRGRCRAGSAPGRSRPAAPGPAGSPRRGSSPLFPLYSFLAVSQIDVADPGVVDTTSMVSSIRMRPWWNTVT